MLVFDNLSTYKGGGIYMNNNKIIYIKNSKFVQNFCDL